jgi:FtsZ-binding cell division protein ZapB
LFSVPQAGKCTWHINTDFELCVSNISCYGDKSIFAEIAASSDATEVIASFEVSDACDVTVDCEIEALNARQTVKLLKYEYGNRLAHLEQLLQGERVLQGENERLKGRNEDLQSQNRGLQSQNEDLQNKNGSLQQALINVEGECQQLRDKENQLKNEVMALRNSRSYRLGNVFARIVRFFIPRGSRRALCCRLLYTMVRHPVIFLRKVSLRRVKKFFRLLKSGESEYAGKMVQNVIGDGAASLLPITAPDIVPVGTKEKRFEDYPVLHVPQWENPQVSIIIPVYNQFEFTYRCVESILRNTGSATYEILIANDCSTDLTTRIEEIMPGVRCITTPQNLRFLRNCNNAAKHAVGQYVLFLNNDTQVQPDWLTPLITLIESADDIGMVGSKLIYPDGKL